MGDVADGTVLRMLGARWVRVRRRSQHAPEERYRDRDAEEAARPPSVRPVHAQYKVPRLEGLHYLLNSCWVTTEYHQYTNSRQPASLPGDAAAGSRVTC